MTFHRRAPLGQLPAMSHVQGLNFCHIGVTGDRFPGVRWSSDAGQPLPGSSGQAVQNANLMLTDETAGLMLAPVFP